MMARQRQQQQQQQTKDNNSNANHSNRKDLSTSQSFDQMHHLASAAVPIQRTSSLVIGSQLDRDDMDESTDVISYELTTKGKGEATTLLIEGALPVREFPDNLTSNPPPISKYSTDSFGKNDNIPNPYHSDDMSMLSNRSEQQQREVNNDPYQQDNDNSNNQQHHCNNTTRMEANSMTGSFAGGTHEEELRCVIAIVRHGDRTPKQKIKINLTDSHILCFFHEQ